MVVGDRPAGSPSLADDAAEFAQIADVALDQTGSTASQRKVGRGKIILARRRKALASLGVARDFDYGNTEPDSEL